MGKRKARVAPSLSRVSQRFPARLHEKPVFFNITFFFFFKWSVLGTREHAFEIFIVYLPGDMAQKSKACTDLADASSNPSTCVACNSSSRGSCTYGLLRRPNQCALSYTKSSKRERMGRGRRTTSGNQFFWTYVVRGWTCVASTYTYWTIVLALGF